jgi:hypothetical protein
LINSICRVCLYFEFSQATPAFISTCEPALGWDLAQLAWPPINWNIPLPLPKTKLESSFHVQFSVLFSCFCMKMYYNLCCGMLELAEIWILGQLTMSISMCTIRFPKTALSLVNWEVCSLMWNKDFWWNSQVIWDKANTIYSTLNTLQYHQDIIEIYCNTMDIHWNIL